MRSRHRQTTTPASAPQPSTLCPGTTSPHRPNALRQTDGARSTETFAPLVSRAFLSQPPPLHRGWRPHTLISFSTWASILPKYDLANAMIERIGHEQMPWAIHHDSKRVAQSSFEGRAPITPIGGHTHAGDAFNTPSDSIPSPHQMVVRIGHVEISLLVQCNPRWPRETAAGWFIRPLVSIFTAVAHHSSYETSDRINRTNPSVKAIGNEQCAI